MNQGISLRFLLKTAVKSSRTFLRKNSVSSSDGCSFAFVSSIDYVTRIINDALVKAEKAEADAQELRHRVEVYKRRIKEVIDEQREMIDEIGDIRY